MKNEIQGALPPWTASDELTLKNLVERRDRRAYLLTRRVIDVASEIHIHNMTEDEIADGMIQRADEVTRVLRPYLKGPFRGMVIAQGGTGVLRHDGMKFTRTQLREWSVAGIRDAIVGDGWVSDEFMKELTPNETDEHGNRLHNYETIRIDANVATVRCNDKGEYLTVVRIPEGEEDF